MSNQRSFSHRRWIALGVAAITMTLAGSPARAQTDPFAPTFSIDTYRLERVPARLKFQARISQAHIPVGDGSFPAISVELQSAGTVLCSQIFNNAAVKDSVLNLDINGLTCAGGTPPDEVIAQSGDLSLSICIAGNCLAPVALGSVPYAVKSSFSHQAHEARLAEVAGQAHYAHRLSADLDMLATGLIDTGYFQFATPDASYVPSTDDIYTDYTLVEHDGFIAWAPSSTALGNQINICAKSEAGHFVDLDGFIVHAAQVRAEGDLEAMGTVIGPSLHTSEDLQVGTCLVPPILDHQRQMCVGAGVQTTFEGDVAFDGSVVFNGPASFPGGLDAPISSVAEASLQTGAVSSRAIADGAVTGADIAPATITGSNIANLSIDEPQLADNSVSARTIADGTILAEDIAANTIAGGNIADLGISERHLVDGAVSSRAIAAGAVTGVEIAPGAVNGGKIANYNIYHHHLATGAVSSRAIADNAITGADIAFQAIEEANLATGAVSGRTLASGAVTGAAIAAGAVQPHHLSQAVHQDLNPVYRDGWSYEIAKGYDVDCSDGTCIVANGDHFWRWTSAGGWSVVTSAGVSASRIAAGGAGNWLAVADSTAARSVDDGLSWTDVSSTKPATTGCSDVDYGGGYWLAACYYRSPTGYQPRILIYNGATWWHSDRGPSTAEVRRFLGVAYGGYGRWVAVGEARVGGTTESLLWTFSGGGLISSWTDRSIQVPSWITGLKAVASDGRYGWVAAGHGGLVVSANLAVSWTAASIGGTYDAVQYSTGYGWLVSSIDGFQPFATSTDGGASWRTRWGHAGISRLARDGMSFIGISGSTVIRLPPPTP